MAKGDFDPLVAKSLYPKWSKQDSAHKNVGRMTSKAHKEEQRKAFVLEKSLSTYDQLEKQVNTILSKYTF